MERSTTEGGSVIVTEDLENRIEFRPSLSGALERPLPTLNYLLMVTSSINQINFRH